VSREGVAACLLLALGLAQMTGNLLRIPALKGVAAATSASPAPKVFSAVKGLETFSTRFYLEWDTAAGPMSVRLTPELYSRLKGPYNRRNVYGAALAYGPLLATDPNARPMLDSVLRHALSDDARMLKELGIDDSGRTSPIRVRYAPVGGSDLADLPTVLEAP
jgi:hypothetical protein